MSMQPGLIDIAIAPASEADRERFAAAVAKLAAEDPLLRVSIDEESGQTILRGMSELHLDDKIGRLKSSYNLDINVGAPQVAFLERVTRRAEVDYVYKKQSGGIGQFAGVSIVVEPNEPGKGYKFESRIVGGAVPREYIPAVEKSLKSVLGAGVVAGFPVVDVKVQLIDGKYHDTDSSAQAFEIAAREALREGLQKAISVLLEPIMKVEVVTPEEFVTSVIRDLKLRRGQIQGQGTHGDACVISAMAPLMNMFGYVNALHFMSRERASFTMELSHYAPTPSPDDDGPFAPAIGLRG